MRFQCSCCKSVIDSGNTFPGQPIVCSSCGKKQNVPTSPVAPGTVLDDFLIIGKLGTGGMGTVHLAKQISLDRNVALKVLNYEYAKDPNVVKDFIREARSAASINHPGIVQAYTAGTSAGVHYFAMEYVDGMTLKKQLELQGPMNPERILEIADTVTIALDAAWKEKQLVHRDIKPDNIMVNSQGQIKLADLGLACRINEANKNGATEIYGTPQYLPPELLTGTAPNPGSDIYSLGATLYHLLTGIFPYTAATPEEILEMHANAPLAPVMKVAPWTPPPLAKLIENMLEKNPSNRYSDYDELREDLAKVAAGIMPERNLFQPLPPPVAVKIAPPPVYVPPRKKSHFMLWVFTVLFILAVLFLSVLRLKKNVLQPHEVKEPVSQLQELQEFLETAPSQEKAMERIRPLLEEYAFPHPQTEEFTEIAAPYIEKELEELRTPFLEANQESWRQEIADAQAKIDKAREEAQQKAAKAAAEKARLEKKQQEAQALQQRKSAARTNMLKHTNALNFTTAKQNFNSMAKSADNEEAQWAKSWLDTLELAEKYFKLLRNSGRKYRDAQIPVWNDDKKWTVDSITGDTVNISFSQIRYDWGKNMDLESTKEDSINLNNLDPQQHIALISTINIVDEIPKKDVQEMLYAYLISRGEQLDFFRKNKQLAKKLPPNEVDQLDSRAFFDNALMYLVQMKTKKAASRFAASLERNYSNLFAEKEEVINSFISGLDK